MLHLLDPDIYRLSDIEGFRRRIRDRQALGTAFFTFRPDIPPFLLREKVSALQAMFPGDEQLAALLDRVSAALSDPSALPDAVMAARIHISETYRVHRRLLRTRRNDAILDDFPVRGRQRPVTIPVADPDETAQEWLDDWRDYVRSTLESSTAARAGARRAFIAMAERAGSHPGLAAAAARYRLEPDASSRSRRGTDRSRTGRTFLLGLRPHRTGDPRAGIPSRNRSRNTAGSRQILEGCAQEDRRFHLLHDDRPSCP